MGRFEILDKLSCFLLSVRAIYLTYQHCTPCFFDSNLGVSDQISASFFSPPPITLLDSSVWLCIDQSRLSGSRSIERYLWVSVGRGVIDPIVRYATPHWFRRFFYIPHVMCNHSLR